jgi:hypothetical protein
MFLTLVSRKIFVMTIIRKILELKFSHFIPPQFLDLEWICSRGIICGFRERRKGEFMGLGGYNMFCFLGSLGSFQPIMGACHENMGMNFIFEANNKECPKEII